MCAFTLSVQCALIARCTTESIQCDSGQVGGHTHTHTHTDTHTHTVILFLTLHKIFIFQVASIVKYNKENLYIFKVNVLLISTTNEGILSTALFTKP